MEVTVRETGLPRDAFATARRITSDCCRRGLAEAGPLPQNRKSLASLIGAS